MDTEERLAVVAFGGNALHPNQEKGTQREQLRNAHRAARMLLQLREKGYRLLVVHGNGPQVGSILIQMEEASTKVPAFSLDAAVAMSQGSMGYMISLALQNELTRLNREDSIACLLTTVRVDENDPAFLNPTKPIGPFFTAYRASILMKKKGWMVIEDAGRGYRRVVPSPRPREIVNLNVIEKLVQDHCIVIACGGGGIPVVRTEQGRYRGVEAVIDKDYTSALLAGSLKAQTLIILTHVPRVAIYYNTPRQQWLDQLSVEEARRYLEAGQFPPGSMGPKVEAAIDYLDRGGKEVLITNAKELPQALVKESGTWIVA